MKHFTQIPSAGLLVRQISDHLLFNPALWIHSEPQVKACQVNTVFDILQSHIKYNMSIESQQTTFMSSNLHLAKFFVHKLGDSKIAQN